MMRKSCKLSSKMKEYTQFSLMQGNLYILGIIIIIIFLYSYGDIYQLSPIIATLYAILSKVHTYEFTQYENPLEHIIT